MFLRGDVERRAFMDEYYGIYQTYQGKDVFAFISSLYAKFTELKLRYANAIAAMIGLNAVTDAARLSALRAEQQDANWMMGYLFDQIREAGDPYRDLGTAMFHTQLIESSQLTTDNYFKGFYKDLVAMLPTKVATAKTELTTAQTQYAAVQSVIEGLKAQLVYLEAQIIQEKAKQKALLERANALGISI